MTFPRARWGGVGRTGCRRHQGYWARGSLPFISTTGDSARESPRVPASLLATTEPPKAAEIWGSVWELGRPQHTPPLPPAWQGTPPHVMNGVDGGERRVLCHLRASAWSLTFQLGRGLWKEKSHSYFPHGGLRASRPASLHPASGPPPPRVQVIPSRNERAGAVCIPSPPIPAQAPTSDKRWVHGVRGVRMESTQTKGRALQCKRSRFNLREPLHPRSSERAPPPPPRRQRPCSGRQRCYRSRCWAGLGSHQPEQVSDGAPHKAVAQTRQQPGWLSPRGI